MWIYFNNYSIVTRIWFSSRIISNLSDHVWKHRTANSDYFTLSKSIVFLQDSRFCLFPVSCESFAFSFIVFFRSLPQVLCAVLAVQAFCQGVAFLSWRWLRDWARQAVWDRTWRWWSRGYTPSPYLTFLPCQSLSPESRPGLPRPLLLQKKAEPGTVTLANKGPSWVLSVLLDTKYCEYCQKWIIFI